MKAFLLFLLGVIVGAFGWELYTESKHTAATPTAALQPTLADRAQAGASDLKDTVSTKLVEWHLTADDIRADLAKTGQVVRSNARVAGAKISDARILTVIKAKYILDHDLSALDINVDCTAGDVTLRGSVATPELIGKAVALALDTDGVLHVTAKLTTK